MPVTVYVSRTVPRITIICSKVIYPGTNIVKFDTEEERNNFKNDLAYLEGLKTGALREDTDPPEPVVKQAPVSEIKTIYPPEEDERKKLPKKKKKDGDWPLE